MTNDQLVAAFSKYLQQHRSENTFISYGIDIRQFRDYCNRNKLDMLTLRPLHIGTFLDTFDGIKRSTRNRKLNAIWALYHWAIFSELTKENPADLVERLKGEKKEVGVIPDTRLKRLRQEAEKDVLLSALLEFITSTGVRASEIGSIDTHKVNFNTREALVMGKGSKERLVYFSEVARDRLRTYLQSRVDNSPALFANYDGKRFNRNMVYSRLRKLGTNLIKQDRKKAEEQKKKLTPEQYDKWLREQTKIEHDNRIYPHLFRHTFATALVKHGAVVTEVQDALGHENMTTTSRYAHPQRMKQTDYDRIIKNI